MADEFDPYHKWLSIPPDAQPPHHYRLLGLKVFEDDADVIEGAADRQMAHVRGFQSGQRAELSQRILNEIATAKTTLLQPDKKFAYDAQLKLRLELGNQSDRQERPLPVVGTPSISAPRPLPPAAPPPVQAPPPAMRHTEPAPIDSVAVSSSNNPVIQKRSAAAGRRSSSAIVVSALIGCVVLAALGALLVVTHDSGDGSKVAVNDANGEGDSAGAASQTQGKSNQQGASGTTTHPKRDPEDGQVNPDKKAPEDPQEASDPTQPDETAEEPTDPSNPDKTMVVGDVPGPIEASDDPAPDGPHRHAIPDKAVREEQRKRIADIFRVADAKTINEKSDIAAQLLRTAAETDDPAAKFALLNWARELAADSGRIRLAYEAIDQLVTSYELDPESVRLASLKLAVDAPLPPAAKFEVVTVGVEAIDRWLLSDQFALYESLMPVLQELARRANDPQVMKMLNERRRIGDQMHARYKKVKPALEVLKTKPDDADANTTVGKYVGFFKGNWQRGVPMLAKGSDLALRKAAAAELTPPTSAADMLDLADLWWVLVTAPDKEVAAFAKARGGYWYSEAADELNGLDKAKADRRVAEAGQFAAAAGPLETNHTVKASIDRTTKSPPDLVAHWKFDEAQGDTARDSAGKNPGKVHGATWTKRGSSGALSFDGKDDFVEFGNPDELNFDGQITVAAWVRPQDRAAGVTFMNITSHAGSGREVYLRISNSMYAAGGYTGTHVPVEAHLPDEDLGAWVHFAGVYDGKAWNLYRNGQSILGLQTTHGGVKVDGNWAIGASSDGKARFFNGDIDDVRIYNRALSAEELAEIYRDTKDNAAASGDPREVGTTKIPEPARTTRPLPSVETVIVKAVYGAGNAQKDVTDILRQALEDDPFAPLQADDRTMGDPASGQQKQLAIQFQINRRPQTVNLSQQQPLPVPIPPADGMVVEGAAKTFQIVAARYGAGLTWLDVTAETRKQVTSATTPVRWEGLTQEDPWFGITKHYAVWFDYEGRRFVRVIPNTTQKALLP